MPRNPLPKTKSHKVALDALLEMYNDEDYATHQHHADPSFTSQNGKMMEKGTEVEQGDLKSIPGNLLASKTASAVLPDGYQPSPSLTDDMFKWIWSPSTGPVVFNNKTKEQPHYFNQRKTCVHADVIYLNHLKYDETPLGFLDVYPGRKAFRVWATGGISNSAEISNAIDAVAEDFRDMYGLKDWTIEVPPNYGYKGIYQQPKVEDEDGDEGLTQFASDAKMTDKIAHTAFMKDPDIQMLAAADKVSMDDLWAQYGDEYSNRSDTSSKACVACECGDCSVHSAGTINDLTTQVVPGVSEPTVEDATFFKESEDEFEVSRTATGEVVVAATQTYGMGTPVGGVSNEPPPSTQQPPPPVQEVQPTPLTTAPPQQVQNTQPQQPVPPPTTPTTAPAPNQTLTNQQQLQQQLLGQTASRVKLRLACGVEKEFAPAVGTVVKACTDALEPSGYTIRTASHKLSSAGHGDSLVVTVERRKSGATVDPKDVISRVNAAIKPDYFVQNFKTALVDIHESPTSLPPRDDMRRHIDQTEQEEAMEGVHTPTPTTTAPPQQVQQPVQQLPMTNQQKLQQQALASDKKAWVDDDDEDDDGPDGAYGTMYGNPLGGTAAETPQDRLEYLRGELKAERISQGELMELQSLADYIEPGDVELLEAAGVPEEGIDNTEYCDGCQEPMIIHDPSVCAPEGQFYHKPGCKHFGMKWDDRHAQWVRDTAPPKPKPKKRFRTTDKDKAWLKELGIKVSKIAIQVEEGVNKVCPNCHGQEVKNVEDSAPEDGIVECVDCGCFFSL